MDVDLVRARDWCAERVPEKLRDRVRIELETAPNLATVVEWLAPDGPAHGWLRREVARLRFSRVTGTWSLEWREGQRWRPYTRIPPTPEIGKLLAELSRDAVGLFWTRTPRSGGEERRRDVALA